MRVSQSDERVPLMPTSARKREIGENAAFVTRLKAPMSSNAPPSRFIGSGKAERSTGRPARGWLCAFLLAIATPAALAQKVPNPAGTVDVIEGTVSVQRPDKTRYTPKVGDTISEGDAIATGPDSELHLAMKDGGYMAVRPDTKIRIAQFQAIGEPTDKSVIGILEGGLRTVSGWIAKYNPKGYEVRSKIGTIGIRGTDHETHVRLRDDGDDRAGIYDRVFEGGTTIKTKEGQVDVTPNRVGFHSGKSGGKPQLLDRVPRFYRPTRNERLIEGRHARIQPQLEKLREEQRERIKAGTGRAGEKRAEGQGPAGKRAEGVEARRQAREKAQVERAEKAKALHEGVNAKAKETKAKEAKAHEGKAAKAHEGKVSKPRPGGADRDEEKKER